MENRVPLMPYAAQRCNMRGRFHPEPASTSRTEYQRDRDRILHSGAFRRLRNKTQVFIENEGDYYRTRLTHSLEVAQIARGLCRNLGLDEDLSEAIALAHDLGHTCFGHAGEWGFEAAMVAYGGFNHNEQTVRIVTLLESRYADFDGMNLCFETLEGVVKHNGPVPADQVPDTVRALNARWDLQLDLYPTLEAQVAAVADDIAYNSHDVDDGVRAKLYDITALRDVPFYAAALAAVDATWPDLPLTRRIHEVVRRVMGMLVDDVRAHTVQMLAAIRPQTLEDVRRAGCVLVDFSPRGWEQLRVLKAWLMKNQYRHPRVNVMNDMARKVVLALFEFYRATPTALPDEWQVAYGAAPDDAVRMRLLADYIAGMTDRYALQTYQRLYPHDPLRIAS